MTFSHISPPFFLGRSFSSPFQRLAFLPRPVLFPSAFSWVLVQQLSPLPPPLQSSSPFPFLKRSRDPSFFSIVELFSAFAFTCQCLQSFYTHYLSFPLTLSPRTLSAASTTLPTLWRQTSAMPCQLPCQGPRLTVPQCPSGTALSARK